MPAPRADPPPPTPMLALAGALPASDEGWAYEVKWDGVRALVRTDGDALQITSRSGQDLTLAFPELAGLPRALDGRRATLDGELIAFDAHGRQRFDAIQRRLRRGDSPAITRLAHTRPVTYAIFDVLELDGAPLTQRPWHERRAALEALQLDGPHWQTPPAYTGPRSGAHLLAATGEQGLEGIVAKRIDAPYLPGRRSTQWRKIKHRLQQEVVIGGWTPGTGRRAATIGALQVGLYEDGVLRHVGGVGSGLGDATLRDLRRELDRHARPSTPFGAGTPPATTRFVEPLLVCEVDFTGWSDDGQLRHPVFRGLRHDKPASDITREPDEPTSSAPPAVTFDAAGTRATPREGTPSVRVSTLDKPMYAHADFTKRAVIEYYAQLAPVLCTHLAGRALTLRRFPHGAGDPNAFYEKHAPAGRPAWVSTVTMPASARETIEFVEVHDRATLIWLANRGALELHPSLARAAAPQQPTALVFDLDPGAPATIVECCTVALEIRALLTQLDLEIWAKTSGGKGLQLYAPLNVDVRYDDTKPFAHAVAALLESRLPQLVTSRMAKRLRPGRVLIDWSQNDAHKTTVAVYSLRAGDQPTVSTPVTWDEVAACAADRNPSALRFTAPQVLDRVALHGDLFASVHQREQTLPILET